MPAATDASPLFELRDLEVLYDGAIVALRGVSLSVREASIVALLGSNGAGKSTTLKASMGLLKAERGAIVAGEVLYRGERITARSTRARVLAGLAQVLEGRHCFRHLTVEENLISGTLASRVKHADVARRLERIYSYFPRLKEKRHVAAGFTSGGEQQMIAIGRALASEPTLVFLDEPSMGLAPKVVHEIFEIIHALNTKERVTFLLAEQNATLSLRYADHGYVLENGRVLLEGNARELARRPDIRDLYLGTQGVQNERRAPRTHCTPCTPDAALT